MKTFDDLVFADGFCGTPAATFKTNNLVLSIIAGDLTYSSRDTFEISMWTEDQTNMIPVNRMIDPTQPAEDIVGWIDRNQIEQVMTEMQLDPDKFTTLCENSCAC